MYLPTLNSSGKGARYSHSRKFCPLETGTDIWFLDDLSLLVHVFALLLEGVLFIIIQVVNEYIYLLWRMVLYSLKMLNVVYI